MNRRNALSLAVTLALFASLLACAEEGDEPADETTRPVAADTQPATTLYDRLGGETAIVAVVDTFVSLAAADSELNFTRQGTANEWAATPENVELLKIRLVQFVGGATGGPQTYEGRDMATAHAGMQITNQEFDRLAGHLHAALDAYDVPEAEKTELFAIVETTRSAIVAPE